MVFVAYVVGFIVGYLSFGMASIVLPVVVRLPTILLPAGMRRRAAALLAGLFPAFVSTAVAAAVFGLLAGFRPAVGLVFFLVPPVVEDIQRGRHIPAAPPLGGILLHTAGEFACRAAGVALGGLLGCLLFANAWA